MIAQAEPVKPTIVLRQAAADDAGALVALINAAYRKSEGYVFPGTTRTERHDISRLLTELTVAEIDGAIAGCIHLSLTPPEAHFGLLAVDVARHGAGIGLMLIEHAEQTARNAGCTTMRLEVVKEGGDRIPYYERRGYRVTAEHAGQEWNGGADWGAVIPWHMVDMEKPLR